MDFFGKIKMVFQDKGLRGRLLFILGALLISRLLAAIPIPGIDTSRLNSFFAGNDVLNFLNVFSGGGLSKLSIVML
jgi:preprotein translocase subunit SecY